MATYRTKESFNQTQILKQYYNNSNNTNLAVNLKNIAAIAESTLLRVLTAANRKVGLGELQKSCNTETAGASSLAVVCFMLTMA